MLDRLEDAASMTTTRLVITNQIYGRRESKEQLCASLERVASGPSEFTLISGCSGIGKSSLVDEFQGAPAPLTVRHATGKFDAYKRGIPYATIAEALHQIVCDALREGEVEVAAWRSALLEAFSGNGQLLVNLVPALELLVGPQPPVLDVSAEEAKHRFQLLLQRVFSVIARPERPLAMFLDDLQWADPASLDALRHLLDTGIQHLLLIGAYRANEVAPSHPLVAMVDTLRKSGARIQTIALDSLPLTEVHQLLVEVLADEGPRVAELSRLVFEKTEGNPFLVVQLIRTLNDEGLLTFDPRSQDWTWDTSRIVALGSIDNLSAFMEWKLGRLPHSVREAMNGLACVGRSASSAILASALEVTEADLHEALRSAVLQGLVVRTEAGYAFPHDCVQEASYSSIAESERAAIHLRIGRQLETTLFGDDPSARRHEGVFEAAHHMNHAVSLITSHEERDQVARLNLLAADQAMASVAFASAAIYLAAGWAALTEGAWRSSPELAFAINLRWANCRYVTGDLSAAQSQLEDLASRATTRADQCAVACLRSTVYLTMNLAERATEVCLEQLRRFGMNWQLRPSDATLKAEYERLQSCLPGGSPEGLVALPLMVDPDWHARMDVLNAMQTAAVHHDMDLHDLCALHMANMSIAHGHCDASIVAFAELAMVLSRLGDRALGFRFGRVTLQLIERPELARFAGRALVWVGYHITPWTDPIRVSQTLIRRALALATASGDQTFRLYSLVHNVSLALAAGEPLDGVQREASEALAVARKAGSELVVQVLLGQLALIEALRGVVASPVAEVCQLEDPGSMVIAASFYWIRQVQLAVHFDDQTAALHAVSRATSFCAASNTFFEEAEYEYYSGLALAAAGDRAGAARHHDRLIVFAKTGAETFGLRVALVGAELARIDERPLDAEQLFELATEKARAAGLVHEEALACEIAARFYAGRGLETSARAFRARARGCYERWGAYGKVRDLDRKQPEDAWSSAMPARQLDLATVLDMSKAVSSEIELERLFERVVLIASEQAGAGRGLLITTGTEGAHVQAEAVAKAANEFDVRISRAAISSATLPSSIFDHVVQTHQIVSVDDGARPNPFSKDEYFIASRARSILCVPVVRQAQIVAVLYLESNATSHAFTPDRIAILRVLAAQAAISLENARLYSKLRRSELYLGEAQRLTKTGSYGWPIGGGAIVQSDESLRIYGFEPGDTPTAEDLLRLMDPEDRARSERHVQHIFVKGQEWVNEFWITTAAGVRKRVRVVGHAIESTTGLEAIGSVMDVTAATLAEAELRRTQLYLNRAQSLSHTGAFGWNIETGSIFWSDEARAIYGYDRSVVPTPAHVLDRIHPDDKARVAEQVERVIANEEDWISEFRMLLPGGQLKHVHVTATAIRDSAGTREYVGVLMDVTAARLAEDELRASRHQYALTLSSIADGVIATNKQERVTFINPVAEVLTGSTQAESLGKPLDAVYRLVPGDGPLVLLGEGGRHIPIDERRSPILDDAGIHSGSVLVFRDDTQRRMAEDAAGLRIANERLQLALRGSSVGMFDADLSQDSDSPVGPNYTFNFWEPLGYEEPSLSEGVVSSRFHPERWHPEDRIMVREALESHLAGRTEQYYVVGRMLHRNGSYRWYLQRAKAVRDPSGKPTRLLGTLVDITERKDLEAQLLLAKEVAEAANQAKDDFLANVSHEIRTPMNAILGMTEMVLGEPLTAEQRQWLGNAKLAADSLLVIIDDLLDFAKLEAGKLELAATEFSLAVVLEETLRTLGIRAHLKGLQLTARVDERVSDRLIIGDEGRLRQILLNLVGNAIKFTSQGEVDVVVEPEEEPGLERVLLRFAVRDTGIGIPPDKQSLIFQAFTQQDTSTTRKYGGTGLGLTIASRLASLMSGTISVSSVLGSGSTFIFVAPFGLSNERASSRTSAEAVAERAVSLGTAVAQAPAFGASLRVLVAEDNEFNADLIRQLLQRRGHQVRIASNGTDAMALARSKAFDLMLLDLHMPGMDGFEVIARLREEEGGTDEHLPVVALTARARAEDRERCLAAGMDDFLAKPLHAEALWATIRNVTRAAPSVLDTTLLRAASGDDAAVLDGLCQSLLTHLPRELHRIEEALQARDLAEVGEAAHRLGGMLSAVSPSAGATASALEAKAASRNFLQVGALLERLARQTHAIVRALEIGPSKTPPKLPRELAQRENST